MKALLACGDENGESPDAVGPTPDAAPADAAPDATPDAAPPPLIPVMRSLPWVGGGAQIAVELPPAIAATMPIAGTLTRSDGSTVTAAVHSADVGDGVTIIALFPSSDPAIHAARIAAATALLAVLPPDERVGVTLAIDSVTNPNPVLADIALDRKRAISQIASVIPQSSADSAVVIPFEQARLAKLESKHGTLGRALVLIGSEVTAVGITPQPIQSFAMTIGGDNATSATATSADIARRRQAIFWVGACGNYVADEALTLSIGSGIAAVTTTIPMDHMLNTACSAEQAARDQYPYADEIRFTFTPAQRAIYDMASAMNSETDYGATVKLGNSTDIMAVAHFRGQGSIGCQRKSMTVTLDGGRRRLMQGVANDEFYLISMCLDTRYFSQVWGDLLLKRIGMFSSSFRYVRVIIDGVNRGVYLMMEKPQDAARDGGLATAIVVRRGYDIRNALAEVKFPKDPAVAEQARLRFEQIGDLALNGDPATLEAALDARVDLDPYFQMLATFSLVENGDYIDEAYFYAANENGTEFYRSSGWDTDDIQSLCHGGGGAAIADRCALTYCSEAELDHSMLRSPAIYNRYRAMLDKVLTTLSPQVLSDAMTKTREDLFVAINSDETAAALTEMLAENPAANTEATAKADIQSIMDAFIARAEVRRAALQNAISACVP
jgi:hypothetical protein